MLLPASAPADASTGGTADADSATAGADAVLEAYARLSEVFPGLTVTHEAARTADAAGPAGGAADGWVGAAELAAGERALESYLDWDDTQVLRDYGQRGRPDVVAGFGLHRYAWTACLLFTVPWFLLRRVPTLPVDAVSFHRTEGRMTVRITDFACLPDDPAATLPGARTVPDEAALRAELRTAVAGHLAPVLEGFRPRLRRGARALWGMAADDVIDGLWYAGTLLGEEPRAMAELTVLIADTAGPFPAGAGFRELTGPRGESLPTRDRASCCFFYTLRPEETCVTCPRTGDAERVERLCASQGPI